MGLCEASIRLGLRELESAVEAELEKLVAAQFIREIKLSGKTAEVVWRV